MKYLAFILQSFIPLSFSVGIVDFKYDYKIWRMEHFHFSLGVFFFLIFYLFYLFIYGCVGSSFLCEGFLQLRQVGAILHRGARASHYRGLSCCGAQAPDAQAQ